MLSHIVRIFAVATVMATLVPVLDGTASCGTFIHVFEAIAWVFVVGYTHIFAL